MTVPWLFPQAVAKAEERPKASHNLNRSPAKKGSWRWDWNRMPGRSTLRVQGWWQWPAQSTARAPRHTGHQQRPGRRRGTAKFGVPVGPEAQRGSRCSNHAELPTSQKRAAAQPQGEGKARADMKVGEVTRTKFKNHDNKLPFSFLATSSGNTLSVRSLKTLLRRKRIQVKLFNSE